MYGIGKTSGLGGDLLHRIEVEELGDVAGKDAPAPAVSLRARHALVGRRGAIVTGVDFRRSPSALARSLATDAGVDARFVESNVYDLPTTLSGRFDIVFSLLWSPLLASRFEALGEIVARYLEPGGIFYIAEAHPFIRVFPTDDDITDGSKPPADVLAQGD